MRIKKVSQTTATQAQVVNNTNDSKLNAYSCDYVNNQVKDIYSTTEVETNKIWIDNKKIYRKVVSGTIDNSIAHNLTNVSFVNSYGYIISSSGKFIPLQSVRPTNAGYYIGYYVTDTNIIFDKGNDANGTAYITLEYTKSSQ